jgi:multicomponent K+:H+ antiporter subunit E
MNRLFPLPFTTLAILGLWLVIASSYTVGSLVLGALVAVAIPLWTVRFWPDRPTLRRPLKALAFFLLVCRDIVAANVQVARQVLGPLDRIKPGFVDVPLDLQDPFVATLLAGIVTLTPGTVSIDIDMEKRILSVHALDVPDAAALIAEIKSRYEAPLKEIFAC